LAPATVPEAHWSMSIIFLAGFAVMFVVLALMVGTAVASEL